MATPIHTQGQSSISLQIDGPAFNPSEAEGVSPSDARQSNIQMGAQPATVASATSAFAGNPVGIAEKPDDQAVQYPDAMAGPATEHDHVGRSARSQDYFEALQLEMAANFQTAGQGEADVDEFHAANAEEFQDMAVTDEMSDADRAMTDLVNGFLDDERKNVDFAQNLAEGDIFDAQNRAIEGDMS